MTDEPRTHKDATREAIMRLPHGNTALEAIEDAARNWKGWDALPVPTTNVPQPPVVVSP